MLFQSPPLAQVGDEDEDEEKEDEEEEETDDHCEALVQLRVVRVVP